MLIRKYYQYKYKSNANRSSSTHLKLLAALLGVSVMLSGCGDNEHHEAHEVTEAADEAAQLAIENAPAPEVFEFESIDDAAVATEATDTNTSETSTDAEIPEDEKAVDDAKVSDNAEIPDDVEANEIEVVEVEEST